ncbi:MAG TPA: hypothetical protein VK932_02675, partial [Kofleriaceae bacterium]|nr:hypothetical protein [Kofleriaceae bacterium]
MSGLRRSEWSVLQTAAAALKRSYSVVHVQHGSNGRVVSKDISQLNPGAADQREWDWGGLIGFSARGRPRAADRVPPAAGGRRQAAGGRRPAD